jgi:hypothetical protein
MHSFYHLTKELLHYVIRVPKDQASFVYFTLESHENLAFYSTLDDSLGTKFRDIDLKAPIEWKNEVDHLLVQLSKSFPIDFLIQETIVDTKA